jgi:formylglycine-generating enzyme required for sulfatase activity/predicted Ser/Thr protein kinase
MAGLDPLDDEAVEALFHSALDLPAAEREEFVARSEPDPVRRAAVLRLLKAHEGSSRIEAILSGARSSLPPPDIPEPSPPKELPERIGRYAIRGILGEGGMGIVYLAEQAEPRRLVAVKVLKEALGSERLTRRLRREAEFLARLQHPGIAQVIEAGIDRIRGVDQPFLVMEYVQGLPLLRSVEEKGLGLTERLLLLDRICAAVDHAHRKGVLHRDLKPGNILVDASGQPKVLDFGLARAVGGEVPSGAGRSETVQVAGTLSYMSPEHFSGNPSDVDVRSDVYALGVIAYELLTGKLPHDLGDRMIHEAAQIIREEPPRPLGAWDRRLRGDLEKIVMKALAREKEDRYLSARDLADDIGRFLRNEPVRAHPPGALYRFRAFARRKKALVGGLSAIAVTLILGIVTSGTFAIREAGLRAVAERQRDEILGLADSRRVADCREAAEGLLLWPQSDARLGAIESWLLGVEELERNLPLHRSRLKAFANPSRPEEAWQHGVLEKLVEGIEDLTRPVTGLEARLEKRLSAAREWKGAWEEAIRSIARECPCYGGLEIPPQDGLIPLGRDRDSGLWEFLAPLPEATLERDARGKIEDPFAEGLVLVLLPGGSFSMGSDPKPGAVRDEELPRHEVVLDPFFLSKHEVSFGQWQAVMGDAPIFFADPRLPAVCVSWEECVEFCRRSSLELPTEAQWEYACRTGGKGPQGAPAESIHSAARAPLRPKEPGEYLVTLPVDSGPANPFGLHHLQGNIDEWCADYYRGQYYSEPRSRRRNPICRGAYDRWTVRSLRGGSFTSPPDRCRPSSRGHSIPRFRGRDIGFRPSRYVFAQEPERVLVEDLLALAEGLVNPFDSPATKVRDLERWLREGAALAARLPDLRGRLSSAAGGATPGSGREGLAELVREIEMFADPEEGLLVRLELLCEIERHAEELWEHPRKTIPDRALSPIYGGLEVTPQFGFVPLARDARTGLWTFVHFLGLKVPPRDAGGRLDLKALTCKPTSILRFKLLPGGRFRMGPPAGEGEGGIEGGREVTVQPFFMCIFEVTKTQWCDVMGDIHPGMGRSGRPATDLSPQDCLVFVELTGLSVPTEAQWEHACRAGSDGEGSLDPEKACFMADPDHPPAGPQAVDAFPPNAFGLHNLQGNVWEICMSSSNPNRNRLDVSTWAVRGGSWMSRREDCRPWSWRQVLPGYRNRTNGFRPARVWIAAP